MLPLNLIGTEDYYRVPTVILPFIYPILLEVQPYCGDLEGPPAQVKASEDFLHRVGSIECNCGNMGCRLTKGRDSVYRYIHDRLGTMFILAQADDIMNSEVMFRISALVNEDPDLPDVPPMHVTDAAYIIQQAHLFKTQLKASRKPPRKPRNKKDL